MGPIPKPPIAKALTHYYGLQVTASRGRQKIRCPLHDDSNPSASVDVGRQRWNCFTCVLSEDTYSLVMREESCGFIEAKEFAHRQFGADSQDISPDVSGKPGGGLRSRSGAGTGSRDVRTGVRRFGASWA
ncbi:CHC2 zinc finger domain-containing protein [Streptomyces sp. NPDC087850]|uniref:CHC2 zinc finger domain-containing protein n=1 Tax=Streptomyces sp. NPDC087850 TaxID=3365809 RepID=UPI0037FAAB2F